MAQIVLPVLVLTNVRHVIANISFMKGCAYRIVPLANLEILEQRIVRLALRHVRHVEGLRTSALAVQSGSSYMKAPVKNAHF